MDGNMSDVFLMLQTNSRDFKDANASCVCWIKCWWKTWKTSFVWFFSQETFSIKGKLNKHQAWVKYQVYIPDDCTGFICQPSFHWNCPKWNTNEEILTKSSCPNKWDHQNIFILFDLSQLLLYCIHLTFLYGNTHLQSKPSKEAKLKQCSCQVKQLSNNITLFQNTTLKMKIRPPRYEYVQWFLYFFTSVIISNVSSNDKIMTNGTFPVQEINGPYPNSNWAHQRQSRKLSTQFRPKVNVNSFYLKQQQKQFILCSIFHTYHVLEWFINQQKYISRLWPYKLNRMKYISGMYRSRARLNCYLYVALKLWCQSLVKFILKKNFQMVLF